MEKWQELLKNHEFEEKLICTLGAREKAGGDRREESSAALVIASSIKKEINLRVDDSDKPIKELRQLFEKRK